MGRMMSGDVMLFFCSPKGKKRQAKETPVLNDSMTPHLYMSHHPEGKNLRSGKVSIERQA